MRTVSEIHQEIEQLFDLREQYEIESQMWEEISVDLYALDCELHQVLNAPIGEVL